MNFVRRKLLPLALLTALVGGFYWKLVLTDEFVWFDHPDMANLELPRLEFQAREFHRGRFPLWDPHIWMGQPLLGQTQPGPINPLNVLMMLWPLDAAGYLRTGVLNGYFVAMHLVAAFGMYWLCRELARSRGASIFAACVFSFAGFVGSAPWLDVLSGALWTPWVALFFLRAVRGRRPLASSALGGLFLGVAWLSGHHEVPLLTSLALGCCWIAAIALVRSRRVSFVKRAALMFVVTGLIAAAQLIPTVEFGRLALRWCPDPVGWKDRLPYLSSSIYSFTPRGIFGIAFPDQGTAGDQSVFMGVAASAVAFAGLAANWRRIPVRWLAAVAAGSLVYALGEFTPIHGVLNTLVPGLNKARVPVRALHLFNFAAAVLAGYGIDRAGQWNRRISIVLALAGACILLGALAFQLPAGDALLLSAFVSLAWLTLAFVPVRSRALWLAFALLLMMAELNTTLTRGWRSRFAADAQPFAKALEKHRDIAEFLRRQPAPNRVRVNDHEVPTNFGDLHSIDMHEGYTAGVTANLFRFGRHTATAQRFFAVTHYIGRQPEFPDWEPVFAGADGIKVFRNPQALPRARTVHRVESVATPALLEGRVSDPSFDPVTTALLVETGPALEACDPTADKTAITAYAPNRVRVQTELGCRGLLVLADTFFPGWEALVDGKATRIWEVYGGLRGVVLEGGSHHVDFRYRPASVWWGGLLTALGVLATVACVAFDRLRRPSLRATVSPKR